MKSIKNNAHRCLISLTLLISPQTKIISLLKQWALVIPFVTCPCRTQYLIPHGIFPLFSTEL